MTETEIAHAMWPAAAVVVLVFFMLLFRDPISRFIERTRKVSARGIGIETADASSQAVSGGPPIATAGLSAVTSSATKPAASASPANSAATAPAVSSSEAAHQFILSEWNSPLMVAVEQRVKADFQTKGITELADQTSTLLHLFSMTAVLYEFEQTYADIFGSQLILLQTLNGLGDAGAKVEDARSVYDLAAQQNPEAFKNYPFELYLKWLVETRQLLVRKEDRVIIAVKGREFLAYLMRFGRSFARPN